MNLNLLTEKAEIKINKPNHVKQTVSAGLVSVSGLVSLFYLRVLITGGSFRAAVVSVIFSGTFLVVGGALLESWYFLAAVLVIIFSVFIIIPLSFSILVLVGAALFVLGCIAGFLQMRDERKNQVKFSPRRIIREGLWLVVTFWLIFLGMVYYTGKNLSSMTEIKISPNIFKSASSRVIEPMLRSSVPGFTSRMSVDEFINEVIRSESSNPPPRSKSGGLLGGFFSGLVSWPIISSELTKVQKDALENFRYNLSWQLNAPLKGNENIIDVFMIFINNRVNAILFPYQRYVPVIIFAALLVFIYSASLPIRLVISWVGVGLIYLLKFSQFAKIKTIEVVKEELII